MGANGSKSKIQQESPAQIKREVDDKEHKERVKSILSRPDASTELKSALIECSEVKKSLRDVNVNNDALREDILHERSKISSLENKLDEAHQLNRVIIISGAIILSIMIFLFFVLHLILLKTSGLSDHSTSIGDISHCKDTIPVINTLPVDGELIYLSKERFNTIYSQLHAEDKLISSESVLEALMHSRARLSYYDMLNFIQRELLPEITFSLVATCLGITLMVIAVLGNILPRWNNMNAKLRFTSSAVPTLMFFVLGLYLSSFQDSIDIPAGVLLTIAVLACPIVIYTGIDVLKLSRPRKREYSPHEDEWSVLLSALTVIALSAVLLHSVAFAPLTVVAVGGASVFTYQLIALLLRPSFAGRDGTGLIAMLMWVCTLLTWVFSAALVSSLQPGRRNATYSLATSVDVWLDWVLMLATLFWFQFSYVNITYRSSETLPWLQTTMKKDSSQHPPGIIQLGYIVNFLHLGAALYFATHTTGVRSVTAAAFAHLCGTSFAVEAGFLTLVTYRLSPGLLFGTCELVCIPSALLLFWAQQAKYGMFMALGVLHISMYILLKYGVSVAAVVAVVGIIAGIQFR